jgi:hypothetical protein
MARVLSLREALLPVIDQLRGLPGQLGLRQFTVSIIKREWTGSRVGLGFSTDTETPIRVDLGSYTPKVVMLSSRDIMASGGLYTDQDLKIGPITPPFTGSTVDGNDITVFDPTPNESPTEIFFLITGPGYPEEGAWFKKIAQDVTGNFRYMFTVRKTAEIP